MSSGIPYLRDLVEPSDFVSAYRSLAPSEYIGRLAPSLGLLIQHKLYKPTFSISREFVECELFLGMTELPPLLEALKNVNTALQASSGAIILSLTQEMGFGKTHFEALLFHLYTEIPKRWSSILSRVELEDAVEKLTADAYYKPDVAERTMVLALDLKSLPELLDPYSALFESCKRLTREYKAADAKLLELLRLLVKMEPVRAANELAGYIRRRGVTTPFLILLDELYAGVFETAKGGGEREIKSLENLLLFLLSLIDSLKTHSPVVLVYASARQDIESWERLTKLKEHLIKSNPAVASLITVVEHFKDRTSREEIPVRGMVSRDAVEVVLRRLIRYRAPKDEISRPVASSAMEIVRNYTREDEAQRYHTQLLKTYPFTPTYIFLAEKLLTPTIGGDLPKTQHIRDLLKVSASLVARVYESGDWERVSLISPAHLTHEDLKHLLDERYSMEWGRIYTTCVNSIAEERDEGVRSLAERMLSVVYLKSLTTNILKLLDAIRKPEIIPREEIIQRGTSREDLVFSLVGAVPEGLLKRFYDAFDRLLKAPRIIDVEHELKKYLLISFVFNPMDLIESFKNEEMARLKEADGTLNPMRMVEYFRNQLEREHSLTGQFTKKSGEPGRPKLVLLNYDTLASLDERGKPKLLSYLDEERFTAIVLTPWSIAERMIESGEPLDPVNDVRRILQEYRRDISYLNMLGVVVPKIEIELLRRLCTKMAEINSAKKVVDYLKTEKDEETRRKRLELARRDPTYQTLIDLLKEREEKFEDIILDVMDTLQRKIEDYAKIFTNTAVQDYVGELISSFKHVIHYDFSQDTFLVDVLGVKYETKGLEDVFNKVHAELPVWIADAVINKCGIDKRDSIISKIIKYVLEPNILKNKNRLDKGEKLTIEADPIIESAMRGWKELPIRPLSRGEMESAIVGVAGSRIISGVSVKVSYSIKNGNRFIIVELLEKPPPPPPPPPTVRYIEIWEIGNVIIGIGLLQKDVLSDYVESINITIQTINECGFHITKASMEDLEWIIGENPINTFINRFSPISSKVEFAKLSIELSEPIDKEKIEKKIRSLGISEGNFLTR